MLDGRYSDTLIFYLFPSFGDCIYIVHSSVPWSAASAFGRPASLSLPYNLTFLCQRTLYVLTANLLLIIQGRNKFSFYSRAFACSFDIPTFLVSS